jgi:hypothetical protein
MFISRTAALAALATAALGGSAAASATAFGDGGGRSHDRSHEHRAVLHTSLAPSVPTDPMLLGASPGAVPWVIRRGEADLKANGRLDVDIRGLVIPTGMFAGTTGPVKMVSASLYCDSNTTPVGTSASVPITTDGKADIEATFSLPAKCLTPALLIHPNGANTTYIAASGFGG